MTSTVCHRFIQNAWKKERCSNCFKSKEEHVSLKREAPVSKRPLTTTVTTTTSTTKPKSRGIIKNTIATPGRRKRSVSFKPDLTEIIGFGGEDWSETEEEEDIADRSSESSEDDDTLGSSDDDKDLEKLTKLNTKQNANIAATTTSDRRRTFTQLMLGQPQKDSDGKKQTLLVSVTPFGQNQDETERTPPKRVSKSISHIPIAKNKENLVDARPKVVLTSYSKNRDSPEPTKTTIEKIEKKENEIITNARPSIKEKQLNDKEKELKKSELSNNEIIINEVTTKNVKNEQTLTNGERIVINEEKTIMTNNDKIVNNINNNVMNDDFSEKNYEEVNNGESSGIVETINETSVLKKVDVVSVSPKEVPPVLENARNEQIVKSELKVQLSTSPLKQQDNTITTTTTTVTPKNNHSNSNHQGQDSSEESADSLGPAESREQAGEPDGRADPDVPCEPPALPRSPPPIMITPPPRTSFLHGGGNSGKTISADNKPKVPSKSDKVIQIVRKSSVELSPLPLISQNDQSKLSNKRRAPNPPPTTSEDPTTTTTTTTSSSSNNNVDVYGTQPITTQEIVVTPTKHNNNNETTLVAPRIYGSNNNNNIILQQEENIQTNCTQEVVVSTLSIVPSTHLQSQNPSAIITPVPIIGPEPAPRKNISMSSDNLLSVEKTEEKRKDKIRCKFSLMKFLRVGGHSGKSSEKSKLEEVKEKNVPMPKPRLIIVHPLELNGTIEVVNQPVEENNGPLKEGLPPAPPPRNLPQRSDDLKPPPKSDDLIRKQRQLPSTPQKTQTSQNIINNNNACDNVYANLGEIRSGLAPSKPQRTASMREREALIEQQIRRKQNENLNSQEHVYERVAPSIRHSDESNNNSVNAGTKGLILNLHVKESNYSGSEPDLDIYTPCGSYYGSECEITEGGCSRPCRLRSRKGRSVVHKNLEDNYGAVVVANHEALAQVLEHLHSTSSIASSLRNLQTASKLHWSDFSIVDAATSIIIGRRVFYHALWGAHHVTLSISRDQSSLQKHSVGLGAFSLNPVTEFSDLVNDTYMHGGNAGEINNELVQASVTVFPWMQIDTIQSLGATIKSKNVAQTNVEVNRDACFILLQFVNSLKSLQAQGIEEVPLSLSNFILCHDVDKDSHHRLCLLQGFSEEVSRSENEKLGSLCQCATVALEELFTNTKLSTLIKTLLKKESAMSLSQVKSILEFSLWGPSDVALGVPIKDRELTLQRWLDLERATVLHGLVGTRVQLSVLEEYHLLFLVRSTAKIMCEVSILLESNGLS